MKVQKGFKSKLYNYFVKRLGAFPYRNGWLKVPVCPFCGRELKLGVNLSTYRTNCFRCNYHQNPAQCIMDIEQLETYQELLKFLDNEEFTEYTFKEERIQLRERKVFYLPEGYRLITHGSSQLAKSIRGYIKKRGFSPEYLSKFGVGYCSQGDLYGYLIIPFYYNGSLRYYNARQVYGFGPRYNNPTTDITGLGKEFIIFNHDALRLYNSVFICEGALNALTLGERAIATMGKSISAYQVNELIKSPVERFIILLDPDAKQSAINLAFKLVAYKKVKVVFLPEGCDVNDLGRAKTLQYVYQTRYQDYNSLLKLKNAI